MFDACLSDVTTDTTSHPTNDGETVASTDVTSNGPTDSIDGSTDETSQHSDDSTAEPSYLTNGPIDEPTDATGTPTATESPCTDSQKQSCADLGGILLANCKCQVGSRTTDV